MSESPLHVAVLIVSYQGACHLPDCLDSLGACDQTKVVQHVVVVDNASPDDTRQLVQNRYPHVHLVISPTNRGFTGGNNLGWAFIQKHLPQVRYVCLLNQDTLVTPDFLLPLVQFMQSHPHVGAVQPKLRLHPQTDRINTVGNRNHFMGFGFKTGSDQLDTGQFDQAQPIDFASGAAVLIDADLLQRVGLFQEEMFLYLEDVDLSWKLRQMGYATWYVPDSVVYHKYHFDSTLGAYGYLERNRWWLLLIYYRWATLLLLAPALCFMELGQWVFALTRGQGRAKMNSYLFFGKPSTWRLLRQQRRLATQRRTISDRMFMHDFTGEIPASELKHWALQRIANPLFSLYWRLVRRLMFW